MLMAKYRKLTHCIYHCVYHIVWTPKYRYKILEGYIKDYLDKEIRKYCDWHDVQIEEMNIQRDHIHMVCSVPPKLSISKFMGILKGKTAIKIFQNNPGLKRKVYWGNHFWARGYFVSTVGVDEELIKRYVKHQDKEDRKTEDEGQNYKLF